MCIVCLSDQFKGHTNNVVSVGFSPDDAHIVSGSFDRTIRIWDAETGKALSEPFKGHTSYVLSVGFSPDGVRIVSGSYDNTIRIWDAKTGKALSEPFEGHTNAVSSVGFSHSDHHDLAMVKSSLHQWSHPRS